MNSRITRMAGLIVFASGSIASGAQVYPSASVVLNALRSDTQLKDGSLVLDQQVRAKELSTTKFQHFFKGLEVVGSKAFYQVGRNGAKLIQHLARFDLDVTPTIHPEEAVAIAQGLVDDQSLIQKPVLKILPESDGGGVRLVYWIEFQSQGLDGGREIIIDAHNGALIANLPKNQDAVPVETYSARGNGLKFDVGNQMTLTGSVSCRVTDLKTMKDELTDFNSCNSYAKSVSKKVCQLVQGTVPVAVNPTQCDGGADDPAAMRAQRNAEIALDYYSSHFNRDSYDGAGSPLISIVHAGYMWVGAQWSTSGNFLLYGDGDPTIGYGNFTNALDIAGHEITHGVTAHTARLLMIQQSGALNEANSDFFGIMIANGGTDWAIGRGAFLNPTSGQALRNLADPASLSFCMGTDPQTGAYTQQRPYPAMMRDFVSATIPCTAENDFCNVHINSTIPGHAAYLVTRAIGTEKAERLYYLTLTQALSPRDSIQSAANATKQVCSQIYDGSVCALVEQAYASVGL